ncbi:MAG: FecR family protein [Prevotella sp.]|jgi:ferric-dicitrate binding protein FerR (iron transport regulator)|nr:FecR family protein [Prevotella sp.]MDR2001435.1 FecR family protein [Prevotella sp.]
MKLERNNDWDKIAKFLAKEKEDIGHDHLFSDLSDEDKVLASVLEKIKLDCDYEYAFQIKEEILEKTYRKIFDGSKGLKVKNNRNLFTVLFTIAASIAILLGISNIYLYYSGEQNEEDSRIVFSSPNDISNIILPDSSVVILNKGSILSYTTDYNHKIRNVYLEGEAFFDVRKDVKKAFIVSTDKIDIKVLGTTFNVSAYPENKEIVTSLISGSVQLMNKEKNIICRLQPSQSATYDKKTFGVELDFSDSEYAVGWMTGKLVFKKKSFQSICEALEKKFNYTIVIKNKNINEKRFTGKFSDDETLPEILSIIQINVPFKYKMDDNQVLIY